MIEKKEVTYMNFPISFLGDAFIDVAKTINCIFRYAVFKHSENLEFGDEKARFKKAAEFFSIKFGDSDRALMLGENLKDGCRYSIKSPNASVNMVILWDFYKNKKSEFNIACFCAFCAIKSILGSKEYVKSNKEMILARMFGETKPITIEKRKDYAPSVFTSASKAALYLWSEYDISSETVSKAIANGKIPSTMKNRAYQIKKNDLLEWANERNLKKRISTEDIITGLKEKYAKRYHIDKVLIELQLSWGLKLYSDHTRGFYLSFTKSLEDLALINEQAKRSTKVEKLAEAKRRAKTFALNRLSF